MANKKKKFDLKKIIEVETIIATILISATMWAISNWSDFETTQYKARQAVYNQFTISKNQIIDNINTCLSNKTLSLNDENKRLKNREDLVRISNVNVASVPPEAFFLISKFTRLDDATKLKDLCNVEKKQLIYFQNVLQRTEQDLLIRLKLGR